MTKNSPSRRHAPTLRARLLELAPTAPDPAGAKALARYLRRGGEATPAGTPVVRVAGDRAWYRCPYCGSSHEASRAGLPFQAAPCGERRGIYVLSAANTWSATHLPKWWRARLGATHTTTHRHRYLGAHADLLTQLDAIPASTCPPAPWTRAEDVRTRAIAAAVGVTDMTVRRDLAGATDVAPDAPITGRDGKTYRATREGPAKAATTAVSTRPTLTVIRGGRR